MITANITPEEELTIRAHASDIWHQTWGEASGVDPKKAFIEGYCFAFAIGIISIKNTCKMYEKREEKLNKAIAFLILLVVVAFFL